MSDNESPKISIVTPSFNQGQYLEAAIDSVLSQGYPNLEYIIVDGGSTDNSVAIIKRYAHHLHFWCSEPDGGHYAAVNKGFTKASGDVFAWLNSDDMYCPDAFSIVGQIFNQFPDVSWLTTLKQVVWDSQGSCKLVKVLPGFSKQAFLDGRYVTRKFSGLGFIQQESTFWRRRLWELSGGIMEEISLAGDFDLWSRFFMYDDLYGVDHSLGGFRVHGKNRSLQNNDYMLQAENVLVEMRMKLNWAKENRQPLLGDVMKKIPVIQRFTEFFPVFHKNKYTGSIISQKTPNQMNGWQLTTSLF